MIQLPFLLLKRQIKKNLIKKHNQKFHQYITELEKKNTSNKSILFFPELPNYNAALGIVFRSMVYKIHNNPKTHSNLAISWEDTTYKKVIDKLPENTWNLKCTDISKTKVDEVFKSVFSYSTQLNPETHKGKILEKIELNGHHNAKIIEAPLKPKKGYIYQKIINNQEGKYLFEDIRPVVIKDNIPFCYLNYRLKGKRFSNKKYKALLVKTLDVLSEDEIEKIILFCKKLGVDYCEMDALRDRDNGKLYIIDVNTTAFGPANGLWFEDKVKALKMYQETIDRYIDHS